MGAGRSLPQAPEVVMNLKAASFEPVWTGSTMDKPPVLRAGVYIMRASEERCNGAVARTGPIAPIRLGFV